MNSLHLVMTGVLMLGLGLSIGSAAPPSPAPGGAFDPRRPLERELETGIADGFTLAAVGDLIISRPLGSMLKHDPALAAAVLILKDAGAAFGNLETVIVDPRGFRGWPQGATDDWAVLGLPGCAPDLKTLGFDLLSRANNHALDWGLEGMRETSRRLDDAALVHAGVGESRGEAAAPRYLETEQGRIALVSIASTYAPLSNALAPRGQAPGRPGLNALRTAQVTRVTESMMRRLVDLDREMNSPADSGCASRPVGTAPSSPGAGEDLPPRELTLFGTRFEVGARPGHHYTMNASDLGDFLKNIRLGKQHSGFLIASLHAHETEMGCDEPGDFLPILARAAIDAGADVFAMHGVHQLGPIEIYKDRPIFYGLANFIWSDIQEPLPGEMYERFADLLAGAPGGPEQATDADLSALLNATGFNDERVFQTVIAVSRFAGNRLSEVRLHPIDLGYGRRLTESGVPRLAGPATAAVILERLQRLSRPYGTTIENVKNVGVIRVRSKN